MACAEHNAECIATLGDVFDFTRRTTDDEDSDDGWIGPTLSEAAPEKKIRKKVLPFENVYLENLPDCDTYERSFMHRDVVSWCLSSGPTCFVITGSVDGHVKVCFWMNNYYDGPCNEQLHII